MTVKREAESKTSSWNLDKESRKYGVKAAEEGTKVTSCLKNKRECPFAQVPARSISNRGMKSNLFFTIEKKRHRSVSLKGLDG